MNLTDSLNAFARTYSGGVVITASAWILSTLLFVILIIYISKHPHKRTMPLKMAFIIMFVGGTILYCVCHYWGIMQVNGQTDDRYMAWVNSKSAPWFYIPYVIVRAVIDVGIMFYGRYNSDVFYSLPEAKEPVFVFLFWLIHLIAFYTAATALLVRFGNELLRWIRLTTSRFSDVDIIFGINRDSLAFGRNIADKKGTMLMYVDSSAGEDFEASIREMGGLIDCSKNALKASVSFLRNIRVKPGKIRLRLYALSGDYDMNLQYARIMSKSLQDAGILPEQTELVLLGTDEWKGMIFQSSKAQYGYGSVVSFDESEMSARLLIHEYPLCNAINFDSDGRASGDMDALIVGFGRTGREVLRKVIANGQFEGSKFHATVYDPKFEQLTGFFTSQYPGMFANYDIDFEPHGGRGSKIFRYIQEKAPTLKYIVVCIEDRDTARDIAIHMVDRLQTIGYSLNVYTCDSKSVRCYSPYAKECDTHWIYDSEMLYSGELDRYAMELNHRYARGDSLHEDWKLCGYFERMSSRASVDYLIPMIRRIISSDGTLTPEQRENLAKSEHLRWCAFHYTFGFDVMEKEEFMSRLKSRQDEIRQYGSSLIRPTNNKKERRHACLVEWDGLDEISRLENSITGGNKNYKDSDRMNVDVVAELLRN